MEASKKNRLIAAGWQIGSAEDFLGLTPVETELGEIAQRQRRRLRGAEQAGEQGIDLGVIFQHRIGKIPHFLLSKNAAEARRPIA